MSSLNKGRINTMLRNKITALLAVVLIPFVLMITTSSVRAAGPEVRAVLFYSPTCPHCHKVIDEVIKPLVAKYDGSFVVTGINVLTEQGQDLFRQVMRHYQVPEDEWGVPALLLENRLLKGGYEIPESLPALIDQWLAAGGVDWPQLAGLRELLTEQLKASTDQGTDADQSAGFSKDATVMQKLAQDPLGNGFSIAVLLAMLLSLVDIVRRWVTGKAGVNWPPLVIPILTLLGLFVAGYLSYVEVGHQQAMCGPVGDCNRVQQSPYAQLFGVIPVALLGLSGYFAIAVCWLAREFGPQRLHDYSALAIGALALVGTLFSIYFTFLEPFVIGATCLWCLSSAVIMTALLWASWDQARSASQKLY